MVENIDSRRGAGPLEDVELPFAFRHVEDWCLWRGIRHLPIDLVFSFSFQKKSVVRSLRLFQTRG